MAYVDQAKKAKIAAALRAVVPAGWKYSLAVQNHSTIVMTVAAAPLDIGGDRVDVSPYHHQRHYGETFTKIFEALNTDNFDNSDIQTDYFHVGHYVRLQLGRWNKPFVRTAA